MPDTNLAILLDRLVRRLHVELRRKAPEFDTMRVGPGGSMLLLTLEETGEISMHELAERLVRDKSQMTRSVRSLETKGLVLRQPSQRDSRVTLISLSEAGLDFVGTLQEVLAQTLDETLVALTPEAKRDLQTILETALVANTTQKAEAAEA
ncbi:MAG: MarR family transcriptional regulator [Pseudomonadota bacterium]